MIQQVEIVNAKMSKNELRKEYKKLISKLGSSYREDKCNSMLLKFIAIEVYKRIIQSEYFQKAQNISIFLSMSNEINTIQIIKKIFELSKNRHNRY